MGLRPGSTCLESTDGLMTSSWFRPRDSISWWSSWSGSRTRWDPVIDRPGGPGGQRFRRRADRRVELVLRGERDLGEEGAVARVQDLELWYYSHRDRTQRSIREHEEIIAAIESGDRPRALVLLERNMPLTYESLVGEGAEPDYGATSAE